MKHLEHINIRMTLGRETREVEAQVFIRGNGDIGLFVRRIALVTSHGKKTHIGTLTLKAEAGRTDYTMKDVIDVFYSGMRGNGHAFRSTFRHIGFMPAE